VGRDDFVAFGGVVADDECEDSRIVFLGEIAAAGGEIPWLGEVEAFEAVFR
jgi:hypothetical protein